MGYGGFSGGLGINPKPYTRRFRRSDTYDNPVLDRLGSYVCALQLTSTQLMDGNDYHAAKKRAGRGFMSFQRPLTPGTLERPLSKGPLPPSPPPICTGTRERQSLRVYG